MNKRGREPGFKMTEEHRGKIQKSNILKALVEHAEGKREMSSTQVSAGLGLLKKVMPDLQATALTHDVSDALADLLKEIDGRGRGLPNG